MSKVELIKEIEKLSSSKIEKLTDGYVYKNENESYQILKKWLSDSKKLMKILNDLRYRKFTYIPF